MKKPDIPADESSRIATLHSLNLLDTSPEERFDRLTRLARRIFSAPISLVSLVDSHRQWFKSAQGLEARETPREISFCGHAILDDELLLISDALKDERFADNPLVINNPNIRFYAGCSLRAFDGSKLGTLCVIDSRPRRFNEEDIGLLKDLATLAEQEIAASLLATIDELTSISNRRGFLILAQHALKMCYRQKIPAILLFFDLDQFKAINDRYGHSEGDNALVGFAEQLQLVFRDSDVFARMGGDEFVVLITDTDETTIDSVLTRFNQAVHQHNQQIKQDYEIKYSVGYQVYSPAKNQPIEELLAKADRAMYQQKQSGKSR